LNSETGELGIHWRLFQDRDQQCGIEIDWRESGVQAGFQLLRFSAPRLCGRAGWPHDHIIRLTN
jgi:hypothetical protein